VQVKDSEMGAIVNRELKQRVRSVPGITAHRIIAKQDIKLAAKIVQTFDARFKLWEEVGEEKTDASKEVIKVF
jgi:chorismate mutase